MRDLTPLAGMNLERLSIRTHPTNVKGIEILREMESLSELAFPPLPQLTVEEFWRRYDAGEFAAKKKKS